MPSSKPDDRAATSPFPEQAPRARCPKLPWIFGVVLLVAIVIARQLLLLGNVLSHPSFHTLGQQGEQAMIVDLFNDKEVAKTFLRRNETATATASRTKRRTPEEEQQREKPIRGMVQEAMHDNTTMTSSDISPSPVQRGTNSSRLLLNTNHSRYAYVFVIGGCDPENPAYRGYILNILVATTLLRNLGSKADVVGMFAMLKTSKAETLPDEEVRWLQALGVKIKYMAKIPPDQPDDFYAVQMRKFDILNLTQYSRVLHMDGDIIPLTNLDYLLALSETGILQENVVVSGPYEPANGGFFILAPGKGRLEQVHEAIAKRPISDWLAPRPNLKRQNGNVFDFVKGWGHEHQPPDEWVGRLERGQKWTFLAAHADQGLLYYYVKYIRKNVSFIRYNGTISNWGPDPISGAVVELNLLHSELYKHRTTKLLLRHRRSCASFICDIVHFTGRGKPWLHDPVLTDHGSVQGIWWSALQEINLELDMGLNIANWTKYADPIFGFYPKQLG